ncbi:hypothetical protein LB505_012943 [Fusarium chuoi]|nr:hypothetical protein LB505_012943 [Fusarium chuoi]
MQPVLFPPSRSEATSRRARDASKQGPWRCSNCPKEFAQSEYYALSCLVMVNPFEWMMGRACTTNDPTTGPASAVFFLTLYSIVPTTKAIQAEILHSLRSLQIELRLGHAVMFTLHQQEQDVPIRLGQQSQRHVSADRGIPTASGAPRAHQFGTGL